MALKSNLPKIARGLRPAVGVANKRTAGYVADLAGQLAPKDTEAMADTARVEDGERETDFRAVVGDPTKTNPKSGQPVTYPAHVEFGTESSDAQPFMGPAARAIDHGAEAAIEIRKLIKGASV